MTGRLGTAVRDMREATGRNLGHRIAGYMHYRCNVNQIPALAYDNFSNPRGPHDDDALQLRLGASAHSQIDRELTTSPLRGSAWMPHEPSTATRILPRGRSWHNNVDDRLTRKLMMLRLRRLHPVLAGIKCTTAGSMVVPSLVQRLEWMLYNAAHSMHEYTHEQSLERRVQALVTQLEPKGVTDQRRQGRSNSKRGRDADDGPATKRPKHATESDNCRTNDRSVFLLENDDNLVALVLSFLSGRTVLRLRCVNRFMWENAPMMVSTLHLETHAPALQHFSSGTLTTLLLRCSKLTTLVVTSKLRDSNDVDEAGRQPTARTMVHRRPTFTRPSRRDGRLTNGFLAGELMLRDITRAFEQGACPQLQELDVGSPLDYFAESDDVLNCLGAFASGRQRGVAGLRYLRLDSTYLGDARLGRLADAFEQVAGLNCFGSLKTLVLRNNFIGEAGCQALLRMLRCVPALRVLDVSGNILTDLDALALAEWLSSRVDASKSTHCRRVPSCWRRREAPVVQLRTLLLQDNFIGQEGLEALSTALNARLIPS